MPKLEEIQNQIFHLKPWSILKDAAEYMIKKPLFCTIVLILNFICLVVFECIEGGISNPLSILWFVGYYILWCVFYRYYYNLRPYFFLKAITSSLKPSTKAVVILFLVMLMIAFLPMLPLFLGYDDLYLDFYEKYVQMMNGLSQKTSAQVSWSQIGLVYGLFSLAAPFLICKPYMAWIASLCRQNLSFAQVGDKMRGNYRALVLVSLALFFLEALNVQAEKIWDTPNYISLAVTALIFVYTNIVFAKMYDFFYAKK